MDNCMTSEIEWFLLPSAAAADNFCRTGWIPSLQIQINFLRYVHLLLLSLLPPVLNYQYHNSTGKLGK